MTKTKIKTLKQLERRMKQLENTYYVQVWNKEVLAINEFLQHNGGITPPDFIEKISDKRILDGAFIFDRIQNKICTHHSPDYRGSLTKKVRKILGFTY